VHEREPTALATAAASSGELGSQRQRGENGNARATLLRWRCNHDGEGEQSCAVLLAR
jgi:hypothetical protein